MSTPTDRHLKRVEESLRFAPPAIVRAVNRARRLAGLPAVRMPGPAAAAGGADTGPGVFWDPASPHRPRGAVKITPPRRAARKAPRRLVDRVLIMPTFHDAAAEDLGHDLPETVAPRAFGTAAELNTAGRWSLRDDHSGPAFDYAGPRLRAIDTEHGLVVSWEPDLRLPWARDALAAIEAGRSAVSVSMLIDERRVFRLPRPTTTVIRARLDHVALLLRGQLGCYPGGRAKVFRSSWADDAAELRRQIAALVDCCRWHVRNRTRGRR